MKTVFDPSFRYTPSFNTDLKRSFAKIRRAQREESVKAVPAPEPDKGNVASINRRTVGRRLGHDAVALQPAPPAARNT